MTDENPPLCLVEGYSAARQQTEPCLFDYPHPSSQHSWQMTLYTDPKRRSYRLMAPIRLHDTSGVVRVPDERADDQCHMCLAPDAKLIGTFSDNKGAIQHVHKLRNTDYTPASPAPMPDPAPSA